MNSKQILPPLPLGTRPCSASCYLYNQGTCRYAETILALPYSEQVVPESSCLHPEAFGDFCKEASLSDVNNVKAENYIFKGIILEDF